MQRTGGAWPESEQFVNIFWCRAAPVILFIYKTPFCRAENLGWDACRGKSCSAGRTSRALSVLTHCRAPSPWLRDKLSMGSHQPWLHIDHWFDLTEPFSPVLPASKLVCLSARPSLCKKKKEKPQFLYLARPPRLQKCSPRMATNVVGHGAGGSYEWAKRGQDSKACQALEESSRSTVEGKHLMGKVFFQMKGKAASCQSRAPVLF